MYRPNFCAECGEKIVRLRWHVWTSRSFCDGCASRFRKERLKIPLAVAAFLLLLGFISGRAGRPASPPLIIERQANSPLNDPPAFGSDPNKEPSAGQKQSDPLPLVTEQVVYICGARTKKGRPCSRRLHGPTRCWQHIGLPAMLPKEKLLLKE
jgi:hypothetical protein